MADLNNPNRPVITDLYADVIDTLRENTKRVAANALPATGGTLSGPISAPNFYVNPGTNPVWHAGNFDPGSYMPKSGGAFNGAVTLATLASTGLHPVPLGQLLSFNYVPDAPVNSVYYGRRNGAWEPVAPRTVDEALVGIIMPRPARIGVAETSWVELNGQLLNKNTYWRLWIWSANYGLYAANDTDWNNWNWGTFSNYDANLFRVPYLVGMFVRGANYSGGGYDPGRYPGSAQTHMFEYHGHGVNDPGHAHQEDDWYHDSNQPTQPSIATQTGGGYALHPTPHPTQTQANVTNVSIQPSGGSETRPINVAYRHFIYAGNPLV